MQVAQLLVKLCSTDPKYNFMSLIRVLIGSDARKLINWVEFAQTLVNKRRLGFLYKTSLWSCRQETMPIHKFLTTGDKYEHCAHYLGYNMTMIPNDYAKTQFNEHMRPMGHMDKLFHLEAFNPRSILAWAAYAKANVARMVTYGFVLAWAKGNSALASRAITLAKMANLKQKDLLIDENMLQMSWPSTELCWSCDPRSVNKDKVRRWNAWVMANTTAWGIKPNAAAFA
jgi:hypothetical protein